MNSVTLIKKIIFEYEKLKVEHKRLQKEFSTGCKGIKCTECPLFKLEITDPNIFGQTANNMLCTFLCDNVSNKIPAKIETKTDDKCDNVSKKKPVEIETKENDKCDNFTELIANAYYL